MKLLHKEFEKAGAALDTSKSVGNDEQAATKTQSFIYLQATNISPLRKRKTIEHLQRCL